MASNSRLARMAESKSPQPAQHIKYLGEYAWALLTDWQALMSGVASIVGAFWATYNPPTGEKAKVLLWTTTAICFVFASYRIWLVERRQRASAEARLGRPLLTGFFQDISLSYIFDEDENQHPLASSEKLTGSTYAIAVRILNESPIPTTVHNFSLMVESHDKRCISPYPEERWIPPAMTWKPQWMRDQEDNLLPQLVTLLGSDKTIT
jgi:hypothetical protein